MPPGRRSRLPCVAITESAVKNSFTLAASPLCPRQPYNAKRCLHPFLTAKIPFPSVLCPIRKDVHKTSISVISVLSVMPVDGILNLTGSAERIDCPARDSVKQYFSLFFLPKQLVFVSEIWIFAKCPSSLIRRPGALPCHFYFESAAGRREFAQNSRMDSVFVSSAGDRSDWRTALFDEYFEGILDSGRLL